MSARKFLDDRPLHKRLDEPVDAPIPYALTPQALTLSKPVRAASHTAQERGDAAEKAVEELHQSLAFRTLYPNAYLTRRYSRRVQHGGTFKTIAPQGPDFGGGIEGRCLEVEVKAVDPRVAKRLPFEHLTDAEVSILSACERIGGVAIVLILYGEIPALAQWCPVPWTEIEPSYRAWRAAANDPRVKRSPVPASLPEATILSHAVRNRVEYLQRFTSKIPGRTP